MCIRSVWSDQIVWVLIADRESFVNCALMLGPFLYINYASSPPECPLGIYRAWHIFINNARTHSQAKFSCREFQMVSSLFFFLKAVYTAVTSCSLSDSLKLVLQHCSEMNSIWGLGRNSSRVSQDCTDEPWEAIRQLCFLRMLVSFVFISYVDVGSSVLAVREWLFANETTRAQVNTSMQLLCEAGYRSRIFLD